MIKRKERLLYTRRVQDSRIKEIQKKKRKKWKKHCLFIQSYNDMCTNIDPNATQN